MKNSAVTFLRHIGLIEGVSFLVLLLIAMPLKYLAGQPLAVKYTGWAHGVLFVIFCAALFRVWVSVNWPVARCAVVFAASLIPLGPFLLDKKMKEWGAE